MNVKSHMKMVSRQLLIFSISTTLTPGSLSSIVKTDGPFFYLGIGHVNKLIVTWPCPSLKS